MVTQMLMSRNAVAIFDFLCMTTFANCSFRFVLIPSTINFAFHSCRLWRLCHQNQTEKYESIKVWQNFQQLYSFYCAIHNICASLSADSTSLTSSYITVDFFTVKMVHELRFELNKVICYHSLLRICGPRFLCIHVRRK